MSITSAEAAFSYTRGGKLKLQKQMFEQKIAAPETTKMKRQTI
ncbi:MAG TPA: hypothetical protein VF648_12240 [Pyrinomonadaceae bacterium]